MRRPGTAVSREQGRGPGCVSRDPLVAEATGLERTWHCSGGPGAATWRAGGGLLHGVAMEKAGCGGGTQWGEAAHSEVCPWFSTASRNCQIQGHAGPREVTSSITSRVCSIAGCWTLHSVPLFPVSPIRKPSREVAASCSPCHVWPTLGHSALCCKGS